MRRRLSISMLMLAVLAMALEPTPSAGAPGGEKALCEGASVVTANSYSKCIDGYWHVVTDTTYRCPDGSQQVTTSRERTEQACSSSEGGGRGKGNEGEGGDDARKANACTREQETRGEKKDQTWMRCVKGKNDTCSAACKLYSANKDDGGDTKLEAEAGTWVQTYPRTRKYYCRCE